jgi:hypothetical protein
MDSNAQVVEIKRVTYYFSLAGLACDSTVMEFIINFGVAELMRHFLDLL